MRGLRGLLSGLLGVAACAGGPPARPPDTGAPPEVADSAPRDTGAPAHSRPVFVRVTLDGQPAAGVPVGQTGTPHRFLTDGAGRVTIPIDLTVPGVPGVAAAHPEARIAGTELYEGDFVAGVEITLQRFDTGDNPAYVFQDPGSPEHAMSAAQCSHCHLSITADVATSAHDTAARNPRVHDLYAGTASGHADATACVAAGGRWRTGRAPGTGLPVGKCYIGDGVLSAWNPGCDDLSTCDAPGGQIVNTGHCADCHAPGIDGALGGRDLLDARGWAWEHGVHCDVCHKVESVVADDRRPGVAGALRILRPTEPQQGSLGPWKPLTFGPADDVLNPRMGSVQRGHFSDGSVCAGCHEYTLVVPEVLGPVDETRWPGRALPVFSTVTEKAAGPLADVPCNACHMPPAEGVGNGADLGNLTDIEPGIPNGWYRPPGTVNRHVFFGPRHAEQRMVDLALGIHATVGSGGAGTTVAVTVQNAGAAHAVPTAETLRSLLLVVDARCAGTPMVPLSGPLLPEWAGVRAARDAAGAAGPWPEARAGDRLRVLRRTGAFLDYTGYGPFGDGRFSPAEKGVPDWQILGDVPILEVGPWGHLTLGGPLPAGDRVLLLGPAPPVPEEGAPPALLGGEPGFAFARVMADAAGTPMVPHFLATDILADTRLLPGQAHTARFDYPPCAAPSVDARLVYRPFPVALRAERGWDSADLLVGRAVAP